MANLFSVVNNVLAAARTVATLIPGTADDGLVAAAQGLAGVLENLATAKPLQADGRTQQQMQQARAQLAAAVTAKAEKTADRFDPPAAPRSGGTSPPPKPNPDD